MKNIKLLYILSLTFLLFSCTENNISYTNNIKASLKDFIYNEHHILSDSIRLETSNIKQNKIISYKSYTTSERLNFDISFVVNDSNPTLSIGRDLGGYMQIIDQTINIYRLDSTLAKYELHETFNLPFKLLKGNKYLVSCDKTDANSIKYSLISAGEHFEIVYNKDLLTKNERRVALAWGTPFFSLDRGSVTITNAVISSNYAPITKLGIWGDSFIEGTSMIDYGLENRWCALLAKEVGENYCPINGKGGERINEAFFNRFMVENEWFNTPYVIISLGTNHTSINCVTEYKKYMKKTIDYLKRRGQIPILVTITPRPEADYNTITKSINEWVRNSGELYIDIHKAVTTLDNPSLWKENFVQLDGVHPTKIGHQAMFRQLKIDCPFLYVL